MIMRLELICSGLTKLLVDNNYSPTTINFYKRKKKKWIPNRNRKE